jgi:nucleotide-binding universal stress UspA family protein
MTSSEQLDPGADRTNEPNMTPERRTTGARETRVDDPVPDGAVVVGLDGSDKDDAAIAFAGREAELLGAPVHLLTAHEVHAGLIAAWDAGSVPLGLEPHVGEANRSVLSRWTDALAAAHPSVPVTASQPWGTPSQALVDASARARIVVVGSGRKGNIERLLLGTTSLDTAMHASCPVVVVGEDPGDVGGPVVVGVDGSEHSVEAARVAGDEAARRGVRLVVVTTWWLEVVDGIVVTEPGTPEWHRVETKHREMLDEVLAPVRDTHPDLDIEVVLRNERPVDAILDLSAGAGILVVGSRGRGGFAGMTLGSVSHKVLQRASVPVAIVRAKRSAS